MSTLAKVSIPHLRHTYQRRRLFQLLDKEGHKPIVWVTGPPGAGKTTLVTSYIAAKKIPCVWYQVDEGDADLPSFFYYLGKAGQRDTRKRRQALPSLTPEYLPHGLPAFTRRAFRKLFSWFRSGSILVFDNYQEVPDGSVFHEVILQGLEELPPGFRAILISRTPPPPELARLQINQRLRVVEDSALRLTVEETKGLAQFLCKRRLKPNMLQRLHGKTQGWVAGVILLLDQHHPEATMPVEMDQASSATMFRYFASQILARCPLPTQRLFLRTAFLPKFTALQATKLSGVKQADEVLANLLEQNFFLYQRAERPVRTFDYHPLFREFLLEQARAKLTESQLQHVQRTAGTILEHTGQLEEAVNLYIELGDWDRLSHVMSNQAEALVTQGRTQLVAQWIDRIPTNVVEGNPWFLYWQALCELPVNPTKSLVMFNRAYEFFEKQGEVQGLWKVVTQSIRSVFHEGRDFSQFDLWFDRLRHLRMSKEGSTWLALEPSLVAHVFYALFYRQPDSPEFSYWKGQAEISFKENSDPELRFLTGNFLVSYYTWVGDFAQAWVSTEILQSIAKAKDTTPLNWILCRVIEATLSMYQLDSSRCLAAADEGLERAKETGVHLWDLQLYGMKTALHLSNNELDAAEMNLSEMATILYHTPHVFSQSLYHVLHAWKELVRDDLQEAFQFGSQSLKEAEQLGAVFPIAVGNYAMVYIHHKLGQGKDARRHWKAGWQAAERLDSPLLRFMGLTAQAWLALEGDDENKGRQALQKAFSISRRQGIGNCFLWLPQVMSQLCAKALENGIEPEWARTLIRQRKLQPVQGSIEVGDWPWRLEIFTLGEFRVKKDGTPLTWTGKAPQRPFALLKALIAFGGKHVKEAQLTDALWPDAEGDAAHKSFSVTLTRLRALLGVEGALELSGGSLSLNPQLCWVDTWAFEELVKGDPEQNRSCRPKKLGVEANKKLKRSLALYNGPFLENDRDEGWTLPLRERLHGLYVLMKARLEG